MLDIEVDPNVARRIREMKQEDLKDATIDFLRDIEDSKITLPDLEQFAIHKDLWSQISIKLYFKRMKGGKLLLTQLEYPVVM